jgi:hypothetical protein
MSQYRHLWAEFMLVVEESFAAFSGVSPDRIAHSPVIPKIHPREKCNSSSSVQTSSISARYCPSTKRRKDLFKGR